MRIRPTVGFRNLVIIFLEEILHLINKKYGLDFPQYILLDKSCTKFPLKSFDETE